MRVAINCRSCLTRTYTGIGRYTANLLKGLSQIDSGNHYYLYVRKSPFNFKKKAPSVAAPNFIVKSDLFNRGLKKTLGPIDIYHSPSPDKLDIDCDKIIVTVHDLIYKTYPRGHTRETIQTTEEQFQHIVKKASKIICCSKSTMNDLKRFFSVSQERLALVYESIDRDYFSPLREDEQEQAREVIRTKGIKGPFILFVGTIEPRKNLDNLLRAYFFLREKKQFTGQLVVAGAQGWLSEGISKLVDQLKLRDHVVFLGYVANELLRYLYNQTEVFVFPSFYEGFGFPILEAFHCAAAVVTSNVSSCPEIASDAALLVDPRSPQAIAEGIAKIIDDKNLKAQLKQKALKRAAAFSFLTTAANTLAVYREVFSGKK